MRIKVFLLSLSLSTPTKYERVIRKIQETDQLCTIFVFFFFLIDKPTEALLGKGSLKGNPKHAGSIHEKPKDKKQKGKHSPAVHNVGG